MKQLLSMIILLLGLSGLQAQTTERQDAVGRIRVVPSVMITYNPYSLKDMYNNEVSDKYRFHLGVGVEAEYRIHEVFGVALGLNYMVQGIKTSKDVSSSYVIRSNDKNESESKMKSLRVPLLFCLHPLENDRLTISTGLQTGFMLDMGNKYKSVFLDLPLGISYSFDDRLQIELRYIGGLSKIRKDDGIKVSRDCLVLSAGVRF